MSNITNFESQSDKWCLFRVPTHGRIQANFVVSQCLPCHAMLLRNRGRKPHMDHSSYKIDRARPKLTRALSASISSCFAVRIYSWSYPCAVYLQISSKLSFSFMSLGGEFAISAPISVSFILLFVLFPSGLALHYINVMCPWSKSECSTGGWGYI